jgi:hypothetical protein
MSGKLKQKVMDEADAAEVADEIDELEIDTPMMVEMWRKMHDLLKIQT